MLGAARHVDFRVPDEARERAADKGARVAGRRNIGIVQHGVTMAAQRPSWLASAFASTAIEARALARRQLARRRRGQAGRARRAPARCRSRLPSRRDRSRAGRTTPPTCRARRSRGSSARSRPTRWRGRTRAMHRRRYPRRRTHRASISPSATATPSELAARDRPIDFSVSRVATVWPRLSASAMRCAVSSGHLICTKCTSAGSAICASAIAARTPCATLST